jgi:hypothetical protein
MTTCVLELGRAAARIDNKREREKTEDRGQTTENRRKKGVKKSKKPKNRGFWGKI